MTERDIQIIMMLSNLCTGIGTILLGLVGVYGVNQWRHQIKFKERYNLARRMILLAHQCEFAFESSRSPFMSVSRKEYFEQLKPIQQSIQRMYALSIECRVVLNVELSSEIAQYDKAFRRIISAYIEEYESGGAASQHPEDKEDRMKLIFGRHENLNESLRSATVSLSEKLKVHFE